MRKRTKKQKRLVGYSIPTCLWAKDSEPDPEEKTFFGSYKQYNIYLSATSIANEYGADLASSLSSPVYYKQIEYTDKKEKKKTKIDPSAAPVLFTNLIYSEKSKKILSLFKTKGKDSVNPFKYLDQYCNVRMALIFEGIFISKTVTSLQIKVHESYVEQLKRRQSLLTIQESDDGSESDTEKDE